MPFQSPPLWVWAVIAGERRKTSFHQILTPEAADPPLEALPVPEWSIGRSFGFQIPLSISF